MNQQQKSNGTPIRFDTIRNIWIQLKRYPMILTALVATSLLAAISEALGIGLLIPLLEDSQGEGSAFSSLPVLSEFVRMVDGLDVSSTILVVAAGISIIALLRGVFIFLSRLLTFKLQVNIDTDLRRDVFSQMTEVELSYIHKQRSGDLITTLNNFTRETGMMINTLGTVFFNIFVVIIFAIFMISMSWELTLLAVVLLSIIGLLVKKRFTVRIKSSARQMNRNLENANSIGIESLSALKPIHLFARTDFIKTRYENAVLSYKKMFDRRNLFISMVEPLFNGFNAMALSVLLIASTFLLVDQLATLKTTIVLFIVIMYRLMGPASGLNRTQAVVTSYYPALESILKFLNRNDKPYLRNGETQFETFNDTIAFNDLTFHYEQTEPAVLKNITISIPKNQFTAVVGPSGGGKSTLVNLIARLYDGQEGNITVDGIDIKNLDIASWRTKLAVVSQDSFVFNDTVWSNLRFADQDATDEQIIQAAKLANAHNFISELPDQYNTVLGDRGVRLSGGQQQRIAIARAMLANPQLLILDEATSNLDSETEHAIQTAIEQFGSSRTVLAIAHRLSTIRDADNIIVLDQGKVVQQGTHDELMQQGGVYQKLVQMQQLEETTKV